LCFTFVGSTLDGVAGVALLSGAILVADPLAVLSQSLWLSAFAVAGLIFWFQWLPLPAGRWRWPWKALFALVHLQAGVTLLLMPLQLLLFHGQPDVDGR
jgi:competence protein ComEC